jgi:hypothetical protein
MRTFALMLIYCLAALVLEGTWLSSFPTAFAHVDFLIVAVAAISFYREWKEALPLLVVFGVLADIASDCPFGVSLLTYLAIYGFIRTMISKISFQGGPALVFWVAIISALGKAINMLLIMAITGNVGIAKIMVQLMPLQTALDALISLALIPFIRWYWDLSWEKITRPKGLVLR